MSLFLSSVSQQWTQKFHKSMFRIFSIVDMLLLELCCFIYRAWKGSFSRIPLGPLISRVINGLWLHLKVTSCICPSQESQPVLQVLTLVIGFSVVQKSRMFSSCRQICSLVESAFLHDLCCIFWRTCWSFRHTFLLWTHFCPFPFPAR